MTRGFTGPRTMLRYLYEHKEWPVIKIAEFLDISTTAVRSKMREAGVVMRKSSNNNKSWRASMAKHFIK